MSTEQRTEILEAMRRAWNDVQEATKGVGHLLDLKLDGENIGQMNQNIYCRATILTMPDQDHITIRHTMERDELRQAAVKGETP